MSIRAVASRLLQNGRILLRIIRPQNSAVLDTCRFSQSILPKGVRLDQPRVATSLGLRLQDLPSHARRLFVDGVLNRVTHSLAGDLRRRATKSLFVGDSAPFFALVGVSLASGAGILTKEDEMEGVCWEIRQAVSKLQFQAVHATDELASTNDVVGLESLEMGPAIAKGCSAVVYACRRKTDEEPPSTTQTTDSNDMNNDSTSLPIPPISEYPLAVKMMFNYDAESNATSILRAMIRETVPATRILDADVLWDEDSVPNTIRLAPHCYLVSMPAVFAARVPMLAGSMGLYPDALPPRINPGGAGRNSSLFLLMRRYDCSLRQYLEEREVGVRTATLLLAQLLEAVAHINSQGVAHRDLKTDNVLMDLSEGGSAPALALTDFGCCLADRALGLSLPLRGQDTDRGGNAALMAPEVACAQAGPFTSISYAKSDAWAIGAIAYELFGAPNPFYHTETAAGLRSSSYRAEQLPPLPPGVPAQVARLVANLLSRSPNKRMSAEEAATVCQLLLWAPSAWLRAIDPDVPSSNEVLQWMLCLASKLLCEGGVSGVVGGRRTLPEYRLIGCLLARASLRQMKQALAWIRED